MQMMARLGKRTWFYFAALICLYGALLIANANLGIIDDHTILATLFVGKKIPFFIVPAVGRFYPLDGQELNLISFFSVSPYAFYAYNLFQFVVVVLALLQLLRLTAGAEKSRVFFLLIFLLILTPGFVTSWFRLFVPERGVFFFLSLFLYFYLLFQKCGSSIHMILGLIAANLAMYYKEPVFVMIGSLAGFRILGGFRKRRMQSLVFDILLMLSAVVFLVIYFIVVYSRKPGALYGSIPGSQFVVVLANGAGYLLNDPFITILLAGLMLERLYLIWFKEDGFDPLFDGLIISAFLYLVAFLALNLFSVYYLIPAYVFGIVGAIHFLIEREYWRRTFIKIILFVSALVFALNSPSAGVHLISFQKNVPTNFQRTLGFLNTYIPNQKARITIFLDGVNRGSQIEVYTSFIEFLEFRGLNSEQFDIKSPLKSNNEMLFSGGEATSKYTVLANGSTCEPERGDLLILTPYSGKAFSQDYLQSLKNEGYDLLFRADSVFPVPEYSLKSTIKRMMMGRLGVDAMRSENYNRMPLDFYVFRKR